jgi:hypothetical protein
MKKSLFILLITIMSSTFINTAQAHTEDHGKFVHTVFFWLKDPQNTEDRANFEKSLKKFLDSSKFIKTKHLGVPANTDRPIIDQTYSYCLMVSFNSKEEHDKYQEEDVHKVFIKESEKLWQKVLIYDSLSIL